MPRNDYSRDNDNSCASFIPGETAVPRGFQPQCGDLNKGNPDWTPEDQAAAKAAPKRHFGPNRVRPGVIDQGKMYEDMKAAGGW